VPERSESRPRVVERGGTADHAEAVVATYGVRNPIAVETHGDEDEDVDGGPQLPLPGIKQASILSSVMLPLS